MCTISVRKYDSFRDRKFKCKDFFFINLFSSFYFSLLGIQVLQDLERKIPTQYEKPGGLGGASSEERVRVTSLLSCKVGEIHAAV